jgi:pimeloyl-ACP methyl ester carboxylesterase
MRRGTIARSFLILLVSLTSALAASAQQTVVYPQPFTVYSRSAPDTIQTNSVEISGCYDPAQDKPLTTTTSDIGTYGTPTPLLWVFGVYGSPPLAPPFNAGNLSVLTLKNGISLAAGSTTVTVDEGGGLTFTYTVSVSGHVATEHYTSLVQISSAQETSNGTYEYSSTYDIESGIQQFTFQNTGSGVYTDSSNGCVQHTSGSQSAAGSESFFAPGLGQILLDPVPGFLNGSSVTQDPNILASGGTPVLGVAADGVAKVLVRISGVTQNQRVNVSILDENNNPAPANGEDGTLTSLVQGSPIPGGVSPVPQSVSGQYFAFVLYQAPLDFARPSVSGDNSKASRQISIQVTDSNNSVITSTSLQILRPPVLFVHGIWSDPGTWGAFVNAMKAAIPELADYYIDYSATHAKGVAENTNIALAQTSLELQMFKKQNQAAAAQFDFIVHSMGGLISNNMGNEKAKFLSPENYGQGYIHKLITIDTPYQGTFFAKQAYAASIGCQQFMKNAGFEIGGAVLDLIPGSTLLKSISRSPLNSAYQYAIAGVMSPTQENVASAAINLAFSPIFPTGTTAAPKLKPCYSLFVNPEFPLNSPTTFAFDTYFSSFEVSTDGAAAVFTDPNGGVSDALVTQTSQLGNFAGNPLSFHLTPGDVHTHIPLPWIGNVAPGALDKPSGNPALAITLLNTPVAGSGDYSFLRFQ